MKHFLYATMLASLLFLVSCGSETIVPETPNSEDVNVVTQEDVSGEKSETPSDDMQNSDVIEFHTSMQELYETGESYTCTFAIQQEEGQYDGKIYVDGKQMLYTVSWMIGENPFENNTLLTEGYSYSWVGGEEVGYKFKDEMYDDEDEMENDENDEYDEYEVGEYAGEELVEEIGFSCKKGVDENVFTLPENVDFQEMPNFEMYNIQ